MSIKASSRLERKGISRGNALPARRNVAGFHVEMNSGQIAPSRCVGRFYRFVIRVAQFERLAKEKAGGEMWVTVRVQPPRREELWYRNIIGFHSTGRTGGATLLFGSCAALKTRNLRGFRDLPTHPSSARLSLYRPCFHRDISSLLPTSWERGNDCAATASLTYFELNGLHASSSAIVLYGQDRFKHAHAHFLPPVWTVW